MLARSVPGNVEFNYRRIEKHEMEPGSNQTETVCMMQVNQFHTPVKDFGVILFQTVDAGLTWQPLLTLQNPNPIHLPADADLLTQHRYQAAYPDIVKLGDDRFLVIFRQPNPQMPDLRPGLTYSHAFQRTLAANFLELTPQHANAK